MSDLLTAQIVSMTPEWAAELLKANDVNRPAKRAAIKRYAQDMKAGKWVLNGEAIIVREDGMLLNGQNRLYACIEAGVAFPTLMVANANGMALDTIDIGVSRSLGDQLHWRGVSNATTVAAAVRWAYRYDEMVERKLKNLGGTIPARDVELEFFDKHRQYFDAAMASVLPKRRRIPGSQAIPIFVHFLIGRYKDTDTADSFYEAVAFDIGDDDNPAALLKDWLANHTRIFNRPSPTTYAAMHVKAARLWITGETVGRLLWKRTGDYKHAEAFPRIDEAPAHLRRSREPRITRGFKSKKRKKNGGEEAVDLLAGQPGQPLPGQPQGESA